MLGMVATVVVAVFISLAVSLWATRRTYFTVTPPAPPVPPPPTAVELFRSGMGPPAVRVKILGAGDLKLPSDETEHLYSQPVVAVEVGPVPPDLVRPLPRAEAENGEEEAERDFVHALQGWEMSLGELVRNPGQFGFAPGQPVRYWSPAPPPSHSLEIFKITLYELMP